ncbi:hypothetical protein GCM10010214_61450 [Streptomyces abikoensis]|nr:hypothetical protein GCM10010214_61450 [Streptomyces abikoensis]
MNGGRVNGHGADEPESHSSENQDFYPVVHPGGMLPAIHSPRGPHPTGLEVVGRDVYSYEPARTSYNHIPGMRPPRDASSESHPASVTPIYDALCSEYRRAFRALPGDRSGEEELTFKAFGHRGTFGYAGQLTGPAAYPGSSGYNAVWDSYYGRQRGGQLPALPPGQRDGRGRGF